MRRIAIVGSRDYQRLDLVESYVSKLPYTDVVVSGGAEGVDKVAITTAKRRGLFVIECLVPPEAWKRLGKAAGPARNVQLVEICHQVVAFWDEESRGTKQVAGYACRNLTLLALFGKDGRLLDPKEALR